MGFRLLAACLAVAAAGGASAMAQTPVKFSLDWSFQGYHAPFTEAQAQGFYARRGLAVTMDRGFGVTDTISKVAGGTYDIGLADINALVKFNSDHPANRVISVFQLYDRTPAAIVTLKKTGIRTPADLRGKTIAAAEADVGRLLFPAFAAANHIDPASVKWQIYAPNLRDAMVVQGRADASTGYTITNIFNLVGAGVPESDIVSLSYADLGVDLYGSALLVREDWMAAHARTITDFISATIQGLDVAIKDPQAGVATVLPHDTLLNAQVELDRLKMVMRDQLLTPAVREHGWGYIDPARMQRTVDLNAQAYAITPPPKPEEISTTRFLPPDSDRLVPKI